MINKEKFFSIVAVTVLGCLMAVYANAQDLELTPQEKQRYDANPKLILPAANKAFDESDYLQVQKLCRFHWIVLGDDAAESEANKSLWDKAKVCMALTGEMQQLRQENKIAEAKGKAEQLLKLNPVDIRAKEVMNMEIPAPVIETPEVPAPVIPVKDEPVAPVQTAVSGDREEIVEPSKNNSEPQTRFGVNAGVTFGSGIFGPDLALSIYDLGGRRIGVEIGAYMFDLNDLSFGVDASLAVRIYNNLYAKAGMGIYRIPNEQHGYGVWQDTYGICPNVGLSYVIGNHFNLGFCIRYMPETKVRSIDRVSTSINNRDYLFAEEVVAIKRGVAPSITIGWIF